MSKAYNAKLADKFIRRARAKYARESRRLLREAAPDLAAACVARIREWHDNARNFDRAEPESLKMMRAALSKAGIHVPDAIAELRAAE